MKIIPTKMKNFHFGTLSGGLPPVLGHGVQGGSGGLPPVLGHSVQGGVRGLAPKFGRLG